MGAPPLERVLLYLNVLNFEKYISHARVYKLYFNNLYRNNKANTYYPQFLLWRGPQYPDICINHLLAYCFNTTLVLGVYAREFPGGLLKLDPAFAYAEPPSS